MSEISGHRFESAVKGRRQEIRINADRVAFAPGFRITVNATRQR